MPPGQLRQVAGGEHRHVFRPVLEGEGANRDDIQPVVEILAEPPCRHLAPEVAIRRSDDAHVDRNLVVAADRHDRPLLKHTEEFRLEFELHLPDLVEKNRASVGGPEAAECG